MTDPLLALCLALLLAVAVLCILILRRVLRPADAGLDRALREEFRLSREEASTQGRQLRGEVGEAQARANEVLVKTVNAMGDDQRSQLAEVVQALKNLEAAHRQEQDKAREVIERKLRQLQEGNERKLEEMRQTVDEKLQGTLEKRLGESFKLVSERLEAVQKGLGEMQSLAHGVGDLKRVLTNVKERGTWGEYRLKEILEQVLLPDQYAQNVQPTGSGERVEFAVRLPGRGGREDAPVWLPIDAKFPKEDYERLVEAARLADAPGVEAATKALLNGVTKCARDIHDKYISPPATTDFAILFLPTEGLYAEVLRQPGFHDDLQQKLRVLVAGPTTLAAILNSLRIGFQTLAIEQRAHEVWRILSAVKTEFGKFGEVLDRVRKQLNSASNTLDQTSVRSRAIERKLQTVALLPGAEADALLELPPEQGGGAGDDREPAG